MENSMEASQNIKNWNTMLPNNSIPGYIYKKTKALILKDNVYPNVHSSMIYCQVMEAT